MLAWLEVSCALTLAPALVLPFGRNGAACGIQVVGARGDDYRVLGVGQVMQEMRGLVQ